MTAPFDFKLFEGIQKVEKIFQIGTGALFLIMAFFMLPVNMSTLYLDPSRIPIGFYYAVGSLPLILIASGLVRFGESLGNIISQEVVGRLESRLEQEDTDKQTQQSKLDNVSNKTEKESNQKEVMKERES